MHPDDTIQLKTYYSERWRTVVQHPIQSKATITLLASISPQILQVDLQTEEAFTHTAGQWLDLSVFIQGETKVGGYTLCTAAGTNQRIELAIRDSTHPVSRWIHHQAKLGDQVTVRGGCGKCTYIPQEGDHILFIVGGIGITPVISMLRSIQLAGLAIKHTLLYSVKRAVDILYQQELEQYSSIHYRYTNAQGRWKPQVLRDHITEKTIIYLFGPPEMIKEWSNYLSAQQLQDRLHFERWW